MNLARNLPLPAVLLAALGLATCTSTTDDNFVNPPPGPPATCTPISTAPGCSGGSVGYSCTADRPDDGDTNLVCDDGAPGAAGVTVYCCAPFGQYFNDCTVDTSVDGCVGDAFGFRCTGPETPDEADSAIACSEGVASGADTIFCCNSLVLPPACAACQADGHGCALASDCCSGNCGGADSATCVPAACGADGGTCGLAANGQPCAGAADCGSNACAGGSCSAVGCAGDAEVEYTCASGSSPTQLDASLACAPGPGGNFCCTLGPP